MTWTKARNGAPCMAYMTARESITTASMSAQCTACRTKIIASAAATASTARIQNMASSKSGSRLVPPAPPFARTWLIISLRLLAAVTGLLGAGPHLFFAGHVLAGGRGLHRRAGGPAWPGHSRRPAGGRNPRTAEPVVVLLVLAKTHRMRRVLHGFKQRDKELFLRPDQLFPVVIRELVLVGHRERPGGTRLDAQAAQDAAQVVDLVDVPVPLARREALLWCVVPALHVDRVGGAGPGAQLAA